MRLNNTRKNERERNGRRKRKRKGRRKRITPPSQRSDPL